MFVVVLHRVSSDSDVLPRPRLSPYILIPQDQENLLKINSTIFTTRDSHVPILIGTKGKHCTKLYISATATARTCLAVLVVLSVIMLNHIHLSTIMQVQN